jgi:hypothetical protein
MKYKSIYNLIILCTVVISFGSCKKTTETELQPLPIQLLGATKTVNQVLADEPRYSSFYNACKKVGLDKEFNLPVSTFTIFVP